VHQMLRVQQTCEVALNHWSALRYCRFTPGDGTGYTHCVRESERACVRVCVRACVSVRVRVCVCVHATRNFCSHELSMMNFCFSFVEI
jgi:hypothetical protein